LPIPPFEPVSTKLAYLAVDFYFFYLVIGNSPALRDPALRDWILDIEDLAVMLDIGNSPVSLVPTYEISSLVPQSKIFTGQYADHIGCNNYHNGDRQAFGQYFSELQVFNHRHEE